MRTRGEILRAHYAGLLKRISTWVSLAVMLFALFGSGAASASTILTSRSATLGSSNAGTSTTVAFSFKTTTTNAIKAIMIQMCTSPLEGSCTTDSNGSPTLASASITAQGGNLTGFAVGAGTPPAPTANTLYLFNAAGITPVVATAQTLTLSNVTIPNAANHEFYFRVTTYQAYTSGGGTTENDFGGMAVSTGTQMSETAVVQESLVMAIGTSGGSCGAISGSPAITLSNSPMGTTTTSSGTALICVNTNASGGYRLAYNGTAFSGGGTTFPTVAAPTAGFSSSPGSQQFGFNLVDTGEAGGTGKCDSSAGGTTPDSGSYCVSSQYNYDTSAGLHNIGSSQGGPSADTIYTATFKANIDTAVKPGSYVASQTYVATGTF